MPYTSFMPRKVIAVENVPNFLVIGAQKAGSTSLWDCLRRHRDVFMPDLKESMFFSHEKSFKKGWEWYTSLFSHGEGCSAVGEASPHYSVVNVYPQAVTRIAHMLPHARLIYCVREPFSALESLWRQWCHSGVSLPNRRQLPAKFDLAIRTYAPMLENVRYWQNLNSFRDYFPDDRLLVFFFEEWKSDPDTVVKLCFRFLGVDDDVQIQDASVPRNSSISKTQMIPAWLRPFARSPQAARVLRRTPVTMRRALAYPFKRDIPLPEWTGELREFVRASLAEDVSSLLNYCGRVPDAWNLQGWCADTIAD